MLKNLTTKILLNVISLMLGIMPALSLELDLSVDEEIRKKYDTSRIEYELPNLPKVNSTSGNSQSTLPKQTPVYTQTTMPNITPITDKEKALKISKWTKFQAKSNQVISDSIKTGTYISFTTTAPVYKKNITIPAGTKFTGIITDSHRPQKTGNGGLVVLKIISMSYNGKTYSVNGKITKANAKKIFFNNIKGKRQYTKGIGKQIDKGENFYKKTKSTSNKMADNPILVILSPIPKVVGFARYTVCTVLSPLTALTTTGGTLSIPAGSQFEIKLLDEAFVY